MSKKAWHADADSQQYLADKACEMGTVHSAQVIYKSRVRATLCGRDPDELRERAHRFAVCQGWRRATVTLTQ